MWRRTYLILILIRLWFALSPSYLHPDENFQGPEVIAGAYMFLQLFFFYPYPAWSSRVTFEATYAISLPILSVMNRHRE